MACYNNWLVSIHKDKWVITVMHTPSDLQADHRQINWVQDPHLKGKVVFDSPFAPFKKWLVIALMMLIFAGVIGYFLPTIAAIVHENQNSTANTSIDNSTETAPLMSIQSVASTPQENGLGLPAVIAAAPQQPKPDEVQRQATAKKLLAQAETQLSKLRLTSPEGDNAYETYQKLLSIAADDAQIVLDKIIDWYIIKGNEYLKANQFTEPTDRNAYAIYQKVTEIEPHNERAKTLLTIMLDTLYKRAEAQQSQNNITEPAGNNLYVTYQELVKIAPTEPKVQELAKKIVLPLLEKADKQMAQKKYTTPEDDNALFTYQEVLVLFPDNQPALAGLNKIVEQYYELALKKQKKGAKESALEMIERGLSIDSDNEKLLELKITVSQK